MPEWVDLDIEFRFRTEFRGNGFFDEDLDSNLFYWRQRLGVTLSPHDRVRFRFQGQDTRTAVGTADPNLGGFPENYFDVREAYVELGDEKKDWWRLRVGRQFVILGNERLVGERRWHNGNPTWDAARLTLSHGEDNVEFFAMAFLQQRNPGFDLPFEIGNLHGVYGTIKSWIPKAQFEPYLFYSTWPQTQVGLDRRAGAGSWTPGFRLAGDAPGIWGYEVEIAAQRGSAPDTDISSWMGLWKVTAAPPDLPLGSNFAFEYGYASGDGDPNDGTYSTFDPLYAARWKFWGYINAIGNRNLEYISANWSGKLHEKLSFRTDWYRFHVANRNDGMYLLNGRQLAAPPPGGAESSLIGHEFDVRLIYRPNPYVSFDGGVGRFFRGPFLRESRGERPDQLFGFIAMELKL